MALTDVNPFPYPNWARFLKMPATTLIANVQTLDAASEYEAVVFRIPKSGTVIGMGFRTATVTTGATVELTLETVSSATGLLTGTLYHANATGTAIIANTDDNVWVEDGRGGGTSWGSFSVTRGDLVAVRIKNPAASPGNLQVAGFTTAANSGFPYRVTNTGGSDAKGNSVNATSFALEYDGGVYYPLDYGLGLAFPVFGNGAYTWDNNDAQTEYGMRILWPFKARVVGIECTGEFDRGIDLIITVYNAAGTALASTPTIYKDQQMSYGGGSGDPTHLFPLDTELTLDSNTEYFIGFKPQGNTSTIDLSYVTVNSSALLGAMPGGGAAYGCYRATQGSGSWTTETTRVPYVALIVDQLDDGASGGGGSFGRMIGA